MRIRSQFVATIAMMGLVLGFVPSATVRAESVTVEPGDLIRGESFSAVYYYGEDGFRYVFPNEKTYFTWYEDFDDVVMLTDSRLAVVQIGGNVTYKPAAKMVKINSDPKTYFVAVGGTLRWVTDETVASTLYGADWNTNIDDIPDGFFGNYTMGEDITSANIDSLASVILWNIYGGAEPTDDENFAATISEDKSLTPFQLISINSTGYGADVVFVGVGETVAWKNADGVNHTATADDNAWGTGTIMPGGYFVRRFDEPGTYTYHCSYHPEMTGTVIVPDSSL